MGYLMKSDYFRLLKDLKRKVKILLETPMYEGRDNIETLDSFAVELVTKYCNAKKVVKRIEETMNDKQNDPK